MAHVEGVADDAATRAVVDPNPATRREAHAATQDRDRHARLLAESRERIAHLETTVDELLDRLLAEDPR